MHRCDPCVSLEGNLTGVFSFVCNFGACHFSAIVINCRMAENYICINWGNYLLPRVQNGLGCEVPSSETSPKNQSKETPMGRLLRSLGKDEKGQGIAEYAVMLAVVLAVVIGTIQLIGSNAGNVFSQIASAVH